MENTWITPAIGAASAIVGSLLTLTLTRRSSLGDVLSKNLSEAQAQILEALRSTVASSREEISKLTNELEELRKAYLDCQESNLDLRVRVRSLERRERNMGIGDS